MGVHAGAETTLIGRAARALGWSFASTALGRLGTLAIGVALARILGPEQFGVYAVAMVALLAVLSFNELGVSLAIVRWPRAPAEIAPTVATLSIVSSLVVYAGCFFGAPVFTAAMGEPGATLVVRLLSLCVVIDGLVATPVALLQRNFRQGRKMVVDQVTTWGGAVTSITCALSGLGAVSLAIGQLTGAVLGAVLFVLFEPSGLRLGFDPGRAVELLRFGLPLAGASLVVFAVGNVDRLIVGAVLGPVPLGVYVLAANLSSWPVAVFSQPVRAVAPATLARLHHDPAVMRSTFASTAQLLAAVTLPVCALLAGAATPLIHVVYGPRWSGAAAVLPWLVALAALRILYELCYDFFVVLKSTRVVLTAQLLWLAGLISLTILLTRMWQAPGAGMAGLAAGLLVLPLYARELHRVAVPLLALARQLVVPASMAVMLGPVAWMLAGVLGNDLVALATAAVVVGAVIAVLVYRMRGVLLALRATGVGDPVDEDETSASSALATGRA